MRPAAKGAPRSISVEEFRQLTAGGATVRLGGGARRQVGGKYRNQAALSKDGQLFGSRAELGFYLYLQWLQRIGEVVWFTRQVPFYLPAADAPGSRAKRYLCDFLVVMRDGRTRIVDVKGFATDVFKLKRSVVEGKFNLKIEIVPASDNGSYTWR